MKKVLIIFLVVLVSLIGLIIVPNLRNYTYKSKQSEARLNLKSIYEVEIKYKNENKTFTEKIGLLKWKVNENYHHLYNFYLTDNDFYPDDKMKVPFYLRPFVKKDTFAIFAVGNLDADPKLDVWFIDEQGTLTNIINDIEK